MRKHSSPSASSCSKWRRRRLGTRPTFQKVSFLREELQLSIEICNRLSRSRQPNPPLYVVVIKMVLKISIYNIPYKVVEVSCLKTGINSPYVSSPFVYILAQLKQQHLLKLFKYKFNFIFLNSSFSTIKNPKKIGILITRNCFTFLLVLTVTGLTTFLLWIKRIFTYS